MTTYQIQINKSITTILCKKVKKKYLRKETNKVDTFKNTLLFDVLCLQILF